MDYQVAELSVFHTCNFSCGYCSFATSGLVQDSSDLDPFKDKAYIDKVFNFFDAHASPEKKWILHLTGGEPLLMPNGIYFARRFIDAGHKLGYNTNLSTPIESNGWMDKVPPDGIFAIVVSLHQEAIDNFDIVYQRVKVLREAGYPLYIRMVAHPQFLHLFEELDSKFREIDVTFSVNPFYAPNYPKGYSNDERAIIRRYTKLHYELIRLEGGVDMSGRRCLAGSKLISVALGRSGDGNIYPCISTANSANKMGNIFEDNFSFEESPITCLRADKVCSCALHFTHGIIPSIDDQVQLDAVLHGYQPSIADNWTQWSKSRQVKTRFHHENPQGTLIGEKNLTQKRKQREQLRTDRLDEFKNRFGVSEVSVPAFSNWSMESSTVDSVDINGETLRLKSVPVRWQILASSSPIKIGVGRYLLNLPLDIRQGHVAVGVLDVSENKWLSQEGIRKERQSLLEFTVPFGGKTIRICLSGFNALKDGEITECAVYPAALLHQRDFSAAYRSNFVNLYRRWNQYRKGDLRSKYLIRKLKYRLNWSHIAKRLGLNSKYRLVDSADIGYACRSICISKFDHTWRVIAANAGDDSLSVIDIHNSTFKPIATLKLPDCSTPMGAAILNSHQGHKKLAIPFFNFDQTSTVRKNTSLVLMDRIEDLTTRSSVDDFQTLLSRRGHWGFRDVHVSTNEEGEIRIATIDRDASLFYLLVGREKNEAENYNILTLDLGGPVEPISIGHLNGNYYITLRNREELLIVDPLHESVQSFSLRGLSRSSAAIGNFRPDRGKEIAVALWGGDPRNLRDRAQGDIAILTPDSSGNIISVDYISAGIHPTDVTAGDFDGDGFAELAVLNYGAGLNREDRTDYGDLQIFKFRDNSFRLEKSIKIPNPRIAAVADIDGDGKDELFVSLFFEKKIVMIESL